MFIQTRKLILGSASRTIVHLYNNVNYLVTLLFVLFDYSRDRSVDVREEITRLNIERDMLHAQNCSLEDQTQKLTTQLQNLHFVLEQFQKGKLIDVKVEVA